MAKVIMINTKTRTIRVENADKNIDWITIKGTHVPIEKGQSKSAAVKSFVEKKRPEAKKESGLDKDKIKAHKQGLIYYDDYAKQQSVKEEKARKEREQALKDKEDADFHEWQKSNPSKKADVSDIVKSYKEKMAAVGPRASIRKTDRIEADAIKEFMTRKLGANRPYDDYYNYWLSGMDKATKDAFNEIYNESEAREMAFSELASDVDHSGLARGEPTYDELEQWSEKQKAKKAEQKRLAEEASEYEKTVKQDRERQQRKEHTDWTRNTLTDDEAEAVDLIRKWKRGEIGDSEFLQIGKKIKDKAISGIGKQKTESDIVSYTPKVHKVATNLFSAIDTTGMSDEKLEDLVRDYVYSEADKLDDDGVVSKSEMETDEYKRVAKLVSQYVDD